MRINPCPFCGSHGVTLAENVGVNRKYYVQCDCLAQGPHTFNDVDAVEAWNIVSAESLAGIDWGDDDASPTDRPPC